ncbi:protein HYPER-SENSITIVITY-RELATED 4-like isoform X1 [Solanum stenotomum]|uniref:protein HYPER-SENSITIVITY-RELATED 4-like isoform X1 n=1 Tax=Solanum stenotomum TaxID=172797 RepID=UPI0020D151E5|nr:protein HYPER-SENSITIVITY-RELATED 4-like isoform X1 [Solanum stenotomum]
MLTKMEFFETMPSSKTILTAATSLTASVILFRSIASDLVPEQLQLFFSSRFQKLSNRLSSQLIVVIEESEGLTLNQMFDAVNVYLGTKVNAWTQRIKVNKPDEDEELAVTVDRYQEVTDYYENVKFTWIMKSRGIKQSEKSTNPKTELRYFELSFHKKQKEMALKFYLPYILKRAKEIKEEKRVVRLHTVDYNGTDYWSSVVLNHPATFDTMAMEPEMKEELIEDLDMFVSRKDYYRRVGKAWKRGYLLYGPPGTGKSSLVAAMANYLKFDVYDLDLREVQCNSDLRRLLIGSSNRSILVIEDIDCNVGLQNRENDNDTTEDDKITLSGLLNFIDGLWSSCGDERIIVFTTNHKDRLDPALLRPGRMDVHIEMSYCTFSGFRVLASNYLKIEEHRLFKKIEDLFQRVKVTPAEVAGELMKSNNSDVALENLVKFLQNKEHEGVTRSSIAD